MKDEFKGILINKLIRLKSKMYCIVSHDVQTLTKQKKLIFKLSLMNIKMFCLIRHKMKRIQSKKHKIGTYDVNKILSCFDDKRYLVNDGITSWAYLANLIVAKI